MKKHEPMTEERLLAIKARAEAATPGPFKVFYRALDFPSAFYESLWAEGQKEVICAVSHGKNDRADAEFLAHAREDVPTLLAEVERLRAGVGRLREREEWLITHILKKDLFLCPMPEAHKCEQRDGLLCCFDSSEMEIRRRCWRYAADIATRENTGNFEESREDESA